MSRFPLLHHRWIVAFLGFAAATAGAAERLLPAPHNLRLVGGYRFPTFANHPEAIRTTAFPRGGMAVWTNANGLTTFWHENGEQGRQILESTTAVPLGSPTAPPTIWPLLDEGDVWNRNELFHGPGSDNGFLVPEGLTFDAQSQRLWASMRSVYATNEDPAQWLAAIDYPSKQVNPLASPDLSAVRAQRYGGGLTIIPQDWADAHVAGNRLAFASGGYASGQGASMGPTLAAMPLAPTPTPAVRELMYFTDVATIGADRDHNAPNFLHREKVARSFADYGDGLGWVYPVDQGVGYWPGSSIRGSGAWIDHPEFTGVLYMANRPIGSLDYSLQTETFARSTSNSLYVVSPKLLAQTASGARDPQSLGAELLFYNWDASNNGGITQTARALSYDAKTGYLWVYYPQVWSEGVESYPIAAAYEFVRTAAELQGDFNDDGQVDHADLHLWEARFSQSADPPGSGGDGNRDGVVDGADFLIWQRDFGADAAQLANHSPTPEPTSGAFAALVIGWRIGQRARGKPFTRILGFFPA